MSNINERLDDRRVLLERVEESELPWKVVLNFRAWLDGEIIHDFSAERRSDSRGHTYFHLENSERTIELYPCSMEQAERILYRELKKEIDADLNGYFSDCVVDDRTGYVPDELL